MSRTRAWVFTINNPTDECNAAIDEFVASGNFKYLCYGPEVGESGTPHIQGYVRFGNAKALSAVAAILGGRAHLESANGDDSANRIYIFGPYDKGDKHKDVNPDAVEYGVISSQGKRNDIAAVKELIKDGSIKKVIEEVNSYQAVRFGMLALPYYEPKRDFVTEVYWFFGSTGTGKSRAAWDEAGPDAYQPVSFKWWDGYDAHENVILDDIRADFCSFNQFLQLFDRYPMRVECKGGSRQFMAKRIWVTSPYDPAAFFQMSSEAIVQLTRRITVVREFRATSV